YEQDLTITVRNRNEAPTDITAPGLSVNENTGAGVTIGQLSPVDPDSGETFTFTRLPSTGLPGYNANEEFFQITSSGVLQTTNAPLDYERRSNWDVRIQVTDSAGNSYTEVFNVGVGNVHEAPVLSQSTVSVSTSEDTVLTGTTVATDPENNISSYAVHSSNASRGSVSVNSSGGWTYTPNANINGADSFQIRVTDSTGLTAVQTVNVNVTAVNDAPAFGAQSFSVTEAALGAGQTLVGTLASSDLEGNAVSYSLVPGYGDYAAFNSMFGLTPGTGNILVQGLLNYEAKSRYDVLVRATDSGGASTDNWVTVNVQNAEEAPTISFTPTTIGSALGWVRIGTINAVDPDGGAITYQVTSSFYDTYEEMNGVWGQEQNSWWNPGATVSIDASGAVFAQFPYSTTNGYDGYGNYWWKVTMVDIVHINVRVRDSAGSVSQVIGITAPVWTGSVATSGAAWAPPGYTPPVVLDLDGDGLELVSLDTSSVVFRNQPGEDLTRTGWVGADDGLLALDRDGDGMVTHAGEISFVQDLPGAKSDLEGLAAFDTDQDGEFDRDDARFGEFQVWRDANQDGISQAEELSSLADQGIDAISLARRLTGDTGNSARDNIISATSEYRRTDGTTGEVGDVLLAYEMPVEGGTEADEGIQAEPTLDLGPEADIDDIDRSAKDPTPAPEPQEILEPNDPSVMPDKQQPAKAPADGSRQRNARWAGDEANASPVERFKRQARNFPGFDRSDAGDDWELEVPQTRIGGALHASLDSVARRRLQMIDAMASFSAEKSSMLELQPQRTVDGRTLQMLTAVQGVRNFVQ
ncbi:MAG TPA: Ig-like domain-containing protein, partial [Polyangiaceae bacterium]